MCFLYSCEITMAQCDVDARFENGHLAICESCKTRGNNPTGKKVRFKDICLLIQMCDKNNRDIIILISFKRQVNKYIISIQMGNRKSQEITVHGMVIRKQIMSGLRKPCKFKTIQMQRKHFCAYRKKDVRFERGDIF